MCDYLNDFIIIYILLRNGVLLTKCTPVVDVESLVEDPAFKDKQLERQSI